jgi:hypothetical protein
MKIVSIVGVALLTAACSSGSSSGSSGSNSIDGNWLYTDAAGTGGVGLTFNADGTYVLTELVETSSTSFNAQVEDGTFTVSGNTITETPQKSSCPGPVPVHQLTYSFQGSNLAVTDSSAVVVLQPNTATASNAAIVIGCFDANNNFTAQPLAPVSN